MASAHDLLVTLASKDRLAFLATFNARIWEVVGGGPQGLKAGKRLAKKLDAQRGLSAVNPQPLPPDGIAMGYDLMLTLAHDLVRNRDGAKGFLLDIDDWCGTGWPRRWPFPWPRPNWADVLKDPRQGGLAVDFQLGGAIAAAHLSAHFMDGEMRDLFDGASNSLLDVAIG
ncbi:MAG TPA: hypothetical protein PKY27_07990 [Arachnia sp.]|jgi:hypothetical protein|nr:hypothetical protein [Propionibacteriaceae bacterium]HQD22181.1 hypothetical protein [Arachnia sp.]